MTSDYSRYEQWKGWQREEFGCCSTEMAHYFHAELIRSGITSLQGKSVFEIGFGNGQFASWATSAGAAYSGSECIGDLVERATVAGFHVFDAETSLTKVFQDASLDLVVSFDVFEHMETAALQAFLHAAFAALRPSGKLVARMPSGDSPFSRAIQHGDLTHCTILGSSAVNQLAGATGFKVESIREPAFPIHGLGKTAFFRRLAISVSRRLTYPIISRVFMGGGQPVLTPNMVFVLVKS